MIISMYFTLMWHIFIPGGGQTNSRVLHVRLTHFSDIYIRHSGFYGSKYTYKLAICI